MPCFVDLEMRVTLSGRDHDGGCFECDPRASDSSWPGPRGTGRRYDKVEAEDARGRKRSVAHADSTAGRRL